MYYLSQRTLTQLDTTTVPQSYLNQVALFLIVSGYLTYATHPYLGRLGPLKGVFLALGGLGAGVCIFAQLWPSTLGAALLGIWTIAETLRHFWEEFKQRPEAIALPEGSFWMPGTFVSAIRCIQPCRQAELNT